jgi:hypothetical protein
VSASNWGLGSGSLIVLSNALSSCTCTTCLVHEVLPAVPPHVPFVHTELQLLRRTWVQAVLRCYSDCWDA